MMVLALAAGADNALPSTDRHKMASPAAALTGADSGRTVTLHVGDELRLTLYENASTGFRWSVEAFDAQVVALRPQGHSPRSAAVGSGGDTTWSLQAKAAGTTQLRLKLWRAWEGDASVQQRFLLNVKVQP
jgi:inhibitor of cysteine peptidase